MAFISNAADRTFSLREALIQFRNELKRLPLGEERYTGSTHTEDFGAGKAKGAHETSPYRPTYVLRIV